MFKSSFFALKRTSCLRLFASRNVKVYKFLPATCKNLVGTKESKSTVPRINRDTVELLEQVSLVGIESNRGIQILEDAIAFADHIFELDTSDVKPLVTVLEDESLYLREDVPKTDVTRSELLSHCKVSEENYYITPVGFEGVPEERFQKPNLIELSSK